MRGVEFMTAQEHWTHKLFVERPELFGPYLEDKRATAPAEIAALKKIFDSAGVPKGGKILDICCGIGRHSLGLAKLGYNVVGVDLSSSFLERASASAKKRRLSRRVRFVLADIRDLYKSVKHLGKFDAAISIFTSIGYFDERSDMNFFRDLSKLCKKNGVFVLETVNRDWIVRNFETTGIGNISNIELQEFRAFNFETSFLENVWKFYRMRGDEREHLATIPFNLRIYGAHELVKMLKTTDWKDAKAYDGLELEPLVFSSLSSRLVIVAER
jgi:SAM-dependent methyltransferase